MLTGIRSHLLVPPVRFIGFTSAVSACPSALATIAAVVVVLSLGYARPVHALQACFSIGGERACSAPVPFDGFWPSPSSVVLDSIRFAEVREH